MKESIKKLGSFLVIILFVAAVFAVVTTAQKNEGNSTISNSTVEGNCTVATTPDNTTTADNNTCSPVENITIVTNTTEKPIYGSGETFENNTTAPVAEAGPIKITDIKVTDCIKTEYANITNEGCYPVDLTGWKIKTGCGVIYSLDGATIQPGATLKVNTDSGKNTENDYFLNAKTHIWVKPGTAKLFYEEDFKY
jgi:hypothetical protein